MAKRVRKTVKRVYRRYARKIRRRVSKSKPSILVTIPVANKALIEPFFDAKANIEGGNLQGALTQFTDRISLNFTGFQPSTGAVNYAYALDTYKQIFLGYLGSKIATKLGANRHLKKIPIVGNAFKL